MSPGPGARRVAIGVGGVAVLLAALDAYVVVAVIVQMAADLAIPVNHLERATPIVTGYLLGYVSAMPLLGQLSDRYGRRPLIQACIAGFVVGSVVTALADGMILLVAGRLIQGIAGGALLPITMALVGDLWEERQRPLALGVVGGLQELGSVVGPLYGWAIALAATSLAAGNPEGSWRWIFWINVPLGILAAIAVQRVVPAGSPPHASLSGRRNGVDYVGGLLLAAGLGALVVGLYNPDPAHAFLPPWGVPAVALGVVVLAGFVAWEMRSRTRLMDLRDVRRTQFFAALGVSFLAGAALLVTLVDVELVAVSLLDRQPGEAAPMLVPFLLPLAVGALLGGVLARFVGDRIVAVGGMLMSAGGYLLAGMIMSAGGYLLIADLPWDILGSTFFGRVPLFEANLVICGLGLGLVIAPLSAAVLRTVPSIQHGVASAALVVARMMGMLLGVAALTAWGLYRFQSLTAGLPTPLPVGPDADKKMAAYQLALKEFFRIEYREIFLITAVLCLVGALVALGLARRPAASAQPRVEAALEA